MVQQAQHPLGTPGQLSAFIINTLFNALVGSTYGQETQDSITEKMTIWYKSYRQVQPPTSVYGIGGEDHGDKCDSMLPLMLHRDILMLPALKQYIYVGLVPDVEDGGVGCSAVEARFNVMHTAFLAIQTASRLDEDSLIKGQQIFQTLFSRHFSEDLKVGLMEGTPRLQHCPCPLNPLQMTDACPRLEEVTSVAVEVVCETNFSPSVHRDSNRGRLLMEGLFAHFFSPHRLDYHTDDCRWFLGLIARTLFSAFDSQHFKATCS